MSDGVMQNQREFLEQQNHYDKCFPNKFCLSGGSDGSLRSEAARGNPLEWSRQSLSAVRPIQLVARLSPKFACPCDPLTPSRPRCPWRWCPCWRGTLQTGGSIKVSQAALLLEAVPLLCWWFSVAAAAEGGLWQLGGPGG